MVRTSISRKLIWLRNRRPWNLIRTIIHPRLSSLYILISIIGLVMILFAFCFVSDAGRRPNSGLSNNVDTKSQSSYNIFSVLRRQLWPSNGANSYNHQLKHKSWGSLQGSCRSDSSNKLSWTSFLDKESKLIHRKRMILDKYHNRIDPKVLVFVETQYSVLGKQIVEVLEASRIRFKLEFASKSLPILTNLDKGKFAVIIFENLNKYLHMNKWNRELIDKYCRQYSVGIIGFLLHKDNTHDNTHDVRHNSQNGVHNNHGHENDAINRNEVLNEGDDFDYDDNHDTHKLDNNNNHGIDGFKNRVQVKGLPLMMIQAKDLYQNQVRDMILNGVNITNMNTNIQQTYHVDAESSILRILKSGLVHDSSIDEPSLIPGSEDWTLFYSNHSAYHPVTYLYTYKDADTDASHIINNQDADLNVFNEHEEAIKKAFRDKQKQKIINNLDANNLKVGVHQDKKKKKISIDKRHVMNIVLDDGSFDGIERLVFGSSLNDFWPHKIILLDAISYLSHNKLSLPLTHYMLIDIDDIFVGESGTRMKREDVEELLSAQKRLSKKVDGFKFNLGFSGKYYHRGTDAEDEGDDHLIANAHHFWWFCHMWSHSQPHLFNASVLEHEMTQNLDFAKEHSIPWPPDINSSVGKDANYDRRDIGHYSIAPHHSGVYPVHEELYETWKRVLNIRVTSTEEYPHLRPARLRRGFIYQGISVLPRQTCGLYTHTIYLDKYPGGRQKLTSSVKGGELFYTLIYNSINIFMTHLSNYGNDRLSIFTFESVVNFINCWTNIKLMTSPPTLLAKKYFNRHPDETDPLWINPCLDKRHAMIWSSKKSCHQLPKLLIIGPQKTGTTALYTFLLMHPNIESNHDSVQTFEEVQFFSGKNYYKGLDWYMNFFPRPQDDVSMNVSSADHGHEDVSKMVVDVQKKKRNEKILFEKSATYFDGELVPLRVHSLLPNAKIIIILISPIKRAYSWYQHQRAHRDVTALNYSFYDVISAKEHAPKLLKDLRNRCLNPGLYNQHLERWLNYYSPQNVLIIDGEELKSDPSFVLDQVQGFLKVDPYLDYRTKLRFDTKKGFFCPVINDTNNQTKCLGKSKGRIYEDIDAESEKFLRDYFMPHNVALSKLLTRIHATIPPWLEEELSRV